MPNKVKRNKRGTARMRRPQRIADSVKDLLGGAHPALARLSDQATRQNAWRGWLSEHLPSEANSQISGTVEKNETLVIFTASAAWSARVRFAVAEIEAELKRAHPHIKDVQVRVLPR